MQRQIHEFDNGVRIFDDQLTAFQRQRYAKRNVHESEEEDLFLTIIDTLPPKSCFVNIGAAFGYYALLAKRRCRAITIHAVEPLERHRGFFQENIRLNQFRPSDFQIHALAIAAAAGRASLVDLNYGSVIQGPVRRSRLGRAGALFQALGERNKPVEAQSAGQAPILRVRTITLDQLVQRVGRTIDLLVMDIQGLEVDVLSSGRWSLASGKIQTIVIGTHGPPIHEQALGLLIGYGFQIEHSNHTPTDQPDGVIVASRGVRRLPEVSP